MADPKKNSSEIPWFWVILLFVVGLWPIAIVILLLHVFEKRSRQTEASQMEAQAADPAVKKPTAPKAGSWKWMKPAGIALAVIGVLNAIGPLGDLLGGYYVEFAQLLMGLGLVGAGVLLFGNGVSNGKRAQRFSQYLAVMGDRGTVAMEELSRTLGVPVKTVEKDLEEMLERRYFGPKAYLNKELGYLIRGGRGDEELLRRQQEAAKAPKETETGYSGILREIRRANDQIADPILSGKIDRLEDIAGRIFRIVEEDPSKKAEMSTFFNYYLPTTQKLLDSYAEFEHAGIEGENLRQAKARIETTMDAIIKGFEHQLDQLYRGEALDVDRDIRVMETMLHRDTATVESDFNLGGGAAQQEKPL